MYISQKHTCKGVQRKLQYTYLKNKFIGCSEEVTIQISQKQTCVFRESYSIHIVKINLWGVQGNLQYTYRQNKLVGCSEKVTLYIS